MRFQPTRSILTAVFTVAVILLWAPSTSPAQGRMGMARSRSKSMLKVIAKTIEKNFYDPELHGLDWKRLQKEAKQKIERANNVGDMMVAIYSMVSKLKDSHTIFAPPPRTSEPLFGFEAKPFGENIFVYEVKKGGAAYKAGIRAGDRLLKVNNFTVERKTFLTMMFFYRVLHNVHSLNLVVSTDNGPPRTVPLQARIRKKKAREDLTNLENVLRLIHEAAWAGRETYFHNGYKSDIGYIQLPTFNAGEKFLRKILSKYPDSKAFIVDLRGNLGGSVETLKQLTGFFEPKETSIADLIGRKKTEPLKVKPKKPNFPIPLFILVDSESASASEMFAYHFQSTGRAVVIGDQTMGAGTAARIHSKQIGAGVAVAFAVQVAEFRVRFPNGEEIENKGVTPDKVCLPTGADLREDRDPCLRLALQLAREATSYQEEKKTE